MCSCGEVGRGRTFIASSDNILLELRPHHHMTEREGGKWGENIWEREEKGESLLADFEWQGVWIAQGQRSSWLFLDAGGEWSGGGRGVGVKARQENAHCDGKVSGGTKEATGSVWLRWGVEQTGSPLSLTPWSGGLATFLISFPLAPPPTLNELVPPLSLLLFGAVLKRSERENRELVVFRTG